MIYLKVAFKISFLFALFLSFQACTFNKLVPTDSLLLKKATIENAPSDEKSELNALAKQNPRQRGFGITDPFLWIYMKQDLKDSNFINNSIKKLFGEEPMFLDTSLIIESQLQMQDYLLNKGYFRNSISYDIAKKRYRLFPSWQKKAFVKYDINPGNPYLIQDVDYYVADKNIYDLLDRSFAKSFIISGNKYDSKSLIRERSRIAEVLNNEGYYKFSKYFIYFEVDTTFGNKSEVNVQVFVQNPSDSSVHKRYIINNISIEPGYSIMDSSVKDTTYELGYRFIGSNFNLKPSVFLRNLEFRKSDFYSIYKVKQTINKLSELQVYKFIDVDFEESLIPGSDTALLDCRIRLTPSKKQEYILELETNTTEEYKYIIDTRKRYYGMAGGITYKYNNILKQAIQWTLGVGGAFDIQIRRDSGQKAFGNYQADINTAFFLPYAFLPSSFFRNTNFNSTKTALSLSYFFQETVDYERATLNFAYTYQFNKPNLKHFVTPIEISRISSNVTNSFYQGLIDSNEILASLFDPHLLTTARWSISFKDQTKGNRKFWRVRWNIFETAGNLPRLAFVLAEGNRNISDTTVYQIGKTTFFQYLKSDIDASINYSINPWSSFAARFLVGVGAPFGNSVTLPFEKRYYIGGANSIRAWPLRRLGPGSYSGTNNSNFSQNGEIKLENNYEYRFDIVSVIKGAVFVDMGNVWTFREEDAQPGGQFKFNTFLSEVAIGTGFGIRLDLVYFILRLDFGIPVRDPAMPLNNRWVIQDTKFSDINFNLGIGYSF